MPQSTDESLWDQSETNFRRKKLDSVHCAFGEDLQQTATWQRCPLDVGDFKLLFKSGPSCAVEGDGEKASEIFPLMSQEQNMVILRNTIKRGRNIKAWVEDLNSSVGARWELDYFGGGGMSV